jgi:hypothetical protein
LKGGVEFWPLNIQLKRSTDLPFVFNIFIYTESQGEGCYCIVPAGDKHQGYTQAKPEKGQGPENQAKCLLGCGGFSNTGKVRGGVIHRQNCPLKILYRKWSYIGFVSDRCKS